MDSFWRVFTRGLSVGDVCLGLRNASVCCCMLFLLRSVYLIKCLDVFGIFNRCSLSSLTSPRSVKKERISPASLCSSSSSFISSVKASKSPSLILTPNNSCNQNFSRFISSSCSSAGQQKTPSSTGCPSTPLIQRFNVQTVERDDWKGFSGQNGPVSQNSLSSSPSSIPERTSHITDRNISSPVVNSTTKHSP